MGDDVWRPVTGVWWPRWAAVMLVGVPVGLMTWAYGLTALVLWVSAGLLSVRARRARLVRPAVGRREGSLV